MHRLPPLVRTCGSVARAVPAAPPAAATRWACGGRVFRRWAGVLATLILLTGARAADPPPLRWSAGPIQMHVDEHRVDAELSFSVANTTDAELVVTAIRSSCGCTLLQNAPLPWRLAPGAATAFSARVDLRGKRGELHKTITVTTSRGQIAIPVRIAIPEAPISEERRRNQLVALADSRAIFRNECASCHAAPAAGRTGAELYRTACGICHDASPRASSVPDLAAPADPPRTPEHWRQWIEHGKSGTLMPPFAKAQGGILDPEQVDSLVQFLTQRN